MNIQRIEENEIPYEELSKFGLTQEMIDDLPEPIMNKFLGGMRTPLLPINQVDGDGVIHKGPTHTASKTAPCAARPP